MNFTFSKDLKVILDTKVGIFDVPVDGSPRFTNLETAFASEKQRIDNVRMPAAPAPEQPVVNEMAPQKAISFTIAPLPITTLVESINALRDEPLPTGQPKLTHLGIFYGLTPDTNQIVLVMRGVFLDGSDDGEKLHLTPSVMSTKQFTSLNLTPSKKSQLALLNQFEQSFRSIHGEDNFITGAYMQFDPLLKALSDLDKEHCPLLSIRFGFMERVENSNSPFNRNCFHLIFRGLHADGQTPSVKQFSTFDDEPGYSGPKPSTPPFGR
ncbi:hypothetical protein [Spirosoma pollinicola]|uniref:Uncharacterized protein n=1 Tax=Spirosoma pollinicola TaxID=2057025 RepID=A0A2K8Z1B8_9BACT|nr:hypothetical protein [Spirosoma pollinicola]AUD03683.1 hypothetical protein CWM47_18725 [Spirosoma pollinicola]